LAAACLLSAWLFPAATSQAVTNRSVGASDAGWANLSVSRSGASVEGACIERIRGGGAGGFGLRC
jgi:hypothetical protein